MSASRSSPIGGVCSGPLSLSLRSEIGWTVLLTVLLLFWTALGCGPYPEGEEQAYLLQSAQGAPPLPEDFDRRLHRYFKRARDQEGVARVAYAAGRAYQEVGRWDAAVEAFRAADRPGFLVRDYARYRLAESLAAAGLHDEAIAAYRSLVEEFPDFPLQETIRYRIAEAHERLGRYEQSLILFEGLRESQTFGRRARYHVGLARLALNDPIGAFQEFESIVEEQPSDSVAQQALEQILRLTQERPELRLSRAQRFYHGLVLNASGRREEARRVWAEVAEGASDELATRARYEIGRSYLRDRRYSEAIATFETALRSGHPNYRTRLEFQRILAVRRSGQRTRALRLFRSFIERNSWSALLDDVMMEYGWTLRSADRFSEARAVYADLLRRFPKSPYAPEAAWLVAWCDMRLGQYARAVSSLNRLIEAYPQSSYAGQGYFWLGKMHERLGHWESAARAYQRVVERNVYYYAVRAAERLEELETAGRVPEGTVARLRERLAPASLNLDALRTPPTERVALLRKLQDTGAEIAELEHLRERADGSLRARVVYHLADAYNRHGNGYRAYQVAYAFTQLPEVRWNGNIPPTEVARMLYPLPFREAIQKAAEEFNVDPLYIAAMMREESRFQPEVVSGAGAHGLMQLMPQTAEMIARKLGIRDFSVAMLRDPEVNIRLGTWYIRFLLDRYGDLVLVSGAYNAGEGRMDEWTRRLRLEDIDEFVENVPFDETRNHIKKVMHAYAMYRQLYGAEEAGSGTAWSATEAAGG